MKTRIGMEFHIDYAHRLEGHKLCGQHHGHTAKILIEIEKDVIGGKKYLENMVMDFSDMKSICKETINKLDHRDLNSLFSMPTSEIIAAWIHNELLSKLPLKKVTFFEGRGKWCSIGA